MILDREHLHLVVGGIRKHFSSFWQRQHFVLVTFDYRNAVRNLISEVTSWRNRILHDGYVSKFKFWSLPCSSYCSSPYSGYDLKEPKKLAQPTFFSRLDESFNYNQNIILNVSVLAISLFHFIDFLVLSY